MVRAALVVATGMLMAASTAEAAPTTRTFGYTGGIQTFQLPEGVDTIDVAADGAAGFGVAGVGPTLGGLGGHAGARLNVPAGALLYVLVGGPGATSDAGTVPGGFNGGGKAFASGGSGGGASDVRLEWPGAPGSLDSRLVVAGGAAGTGVSSPPTAGAFGLGGNGGTHGGGGGGGWYGGGGGSNENPTAGGGGAGSSFVTDFGRIGGATFGTATIRDASISITYDAPEAALSTTALSFRASPRARPAPRSA